MSYPIAFKVLKISIYTLMVLHLIAWFMGDTYAASVALSSHLMVYFIWRERMPA